MQTGALGRIRTCDRLLRRQMLYPTELREPLACRLLFARFEWRGKVKAVGQPRESQKGIGMRLVELMEVH